MTVQFRCPDCEILEVDDEDIGEWVLCPYCGKQVEVPDPAMAGSSTLQASLPVAANVSNDSAPPLLEDDEEVAHTPSDLPKIHRRGTGPLEFDSIQESGQTRNPIGIEEEPTLYHIACDQGFLMEVPPDMIGMEAMCPCCDQHMVLNLRDTVEFKQRKEWEETREVNRLGKFWLNVSIVFAAVIVFGVILLTLARVLL